MMVLQDALVLTTKAIECDCPPTLDKFLAGVETAVASGADFPNR